LGHLFTGPLSIRSKLLIGFAAVALVTAVVAGGGIAHLSHLASVAHGLIDEELAEAHLLWEATHDLSIMEQDLARLLVDPAAEKHLPALAQKEQHIAAAMARYAQFHRHPPPDMEASLREFASGYHLVQDATAQIVALVRQTRPAEARALLDGAWKERQLRTVESLNHLMDHEHRAVRQTAQLIRAKIRSGRTLIIYSFIGGLVLSLLLTIWIIVSITRPIGNLIDATNQIAPGMPATEAKIFREDEIGILTRRFNAMMARLAKSFEDQKRFHADASHELRGPLTIILGEAEVALRGAQETPETYRDTLRTIVDVSAQMGRLIDDLLFLSRSDAGQIAYTVEAVDLGSLLAEVADHVRGLAASRGVELGVDARGDVVVDGDAQRLRQLFVILLDNAIKYTPPAGRIWLALTPGPDGTRASVADTGIGIAAHDLPKIFDRFYRVDAARGYAGEGTGLGLAIARTIVDAHGGRIDVESVPERGTTISVLLPNPSAPRQG
jgi:signal transduction histidine kinase